MRIHTTVSRFFFFFSVKFYWMKIFLHCRKIFVYCKQYIIKMILQKNTYIVQVYQYFTIHRWYFLLRFLQFSWISCTTLFKIRRYQRSFYVCKNTWYHPLLKGLTITAMKYFKSVLFFMLQCLFTLLKKEMLIF